MKHIKSNLTSVHETTNDSINFTFPLPPPQSSYPRRPLASSSHGWHASGFPASQSADVGPSSRSRLARMRSVGMAMPSASEVAGPLSSTMDDRFAPAPGTSVGRRR